MPRRLQLCAARRSAGDHIVGGMPMIAEHIGVLGRALSPMAPAARNARRTSLLVLGAFLCALGISPVFAQSTPSCTVPNTTIAFGDLTSNLLASQNSDITGTISYSCTGTANDSV